MWLRVFVFAFPCLMLGLTWWAAEGTRRNREARGQDVVALISEAEMPRVHPYDAQTEAEHQLVEMVHASLLKLSPEGKLVPDLAKAWRWQREVNVWFKDEALAGATTKRVNGLEASQRKAWGLLEARQDARCLKLTFDRVRGESSLSVLKASKAEGVLPVSVLRCQVPAQARVAQVAVLGAMAQNPALARCWHDSEGTLEIAVIGPVEPAQAALKVLFATAVPGVEVAMQVVSTQPILEEPVLEFDLRDGARWHDGSAVTAADVKTTMDAVLAAPWAVPDKALLKAVRTVEAGQGNRVRVIYWQHVGAALIGWVGLPLVQASWWQGHVDDRSPAMFRQAPPLGAGPWLVDAVDYRSMILRSESENDYARLTLVRNFSAFTVQLGYHTKVLDLFWPNAPEMPGSLRGEALVSLASPTRRGVTLWMNARRGPLAKHEVRSALAGVLDREALCKHWPSGGARPHGSLFVPGLYNEAPVPTAMATDAAEAKLHEAGWIRNVNGVMAGSQGALALALSVQQGSPALNQLTAKLVTRWKELGVQVIVRFVPSEGQQVAMRQGDFDLILREAPLRRSWNLTEDFHSESPSNVTGFADRQLDLQLEALSAEFDEGAVPARMAKVEQGILEGAAVVPLVSLHEETVVRAGLALKETLSAWSLSSLKR